MHYYYFNIINRINFLTTITKKLLSFNEMNHENKKWVFI
jgi:hypothetical protein